MHSGHFKFSTIFNELELIEDIKESCEVRIESGCEVWMNEHIDNTKTMGELGKKGFVADFFPWKTAFAK